VCLAAAVILDGTLNNWSASTFMMKELLDLIEWLKFWR